MEQEQTPRYMIGKSRFEDLEAERAMQARSWRATYASPEHGVTQQWVDEYTADWFSDEQLERSRDYLQSVFDDANQLRLAAKQDDEVVGFVHLQRHEDGRVELAALYTDPSTFGTGLGAQLMDATAEWLGQGEAFLDVASYNQRAIRFYEKYGFETVPGFDDMYMGKIPVVRMVKKGGK